MPYLGERGANRAIVNGGDDGQRRTASAAQAQLERRGIRVAGNLAASSDMDAAWRQAQSAGPIDGLLLAMKGSQARALAPQLAMAGITAPLRVATSQITSARRPRGCRARRHFLNRGLGARGGPALPRKQAPPPPGHREGSAARLFASFELV